MKNKGQAAITDALFFLLIVSGLATTLFVFTANFGKDVSTFVEGRYNSTYATSALKTILYANTPRSSGTLEEAKEVDFLMTLIKEDYANFAFERSSDSNERFNVEGVSAKSLIETIDEIMKPINRANDYLIYIQEKPFGGFFSFPFLYINFFDALTNSEKSFFCSPDTGFRPKLDAFIVEVQANGRSIIPIELREITKEDNVFSLKSNEAEIGLIIWRSKKLESFSQAEWKCIEINP